jgi:hypothetical protein
MSDKKRENLITAILADEKNKIAPNPELLKSVLSELDVTNISGNRSIIRDEREKGRVSGDEFPSIKFYVRDKSQTPKQKIRFAMGEIYNPMAINWKLVLGIVILAVIAGVSYYQFVLVEKSSEVAKAPTDIAVIPATGNVDDVVAALLNDADAETTILANVENDVNLVVADSQAIDDFGQSYNEEF